MPRIPEVRRHSKAGRRDWYTITIGGRDVYLGTNRRKAEAKAGKLKAQHYGDKPIQGKPETVAELIRLWSVARPGREWSLIPWAMYAGLQPLDDLPADHFDAYSRWLQVDYVHRHKGGKRGLKPWSVRGYVSYAVAAMRWARQRGWTLSPADLPKLPQPARLPRDIPAAALVGIFAKLPERAGRILRFCLETGCRPGEACRLQWSHLDLERGVAILPEHKTASTTGTVRTIYLSPAAIQSIPTRQPDSQWVFRSRLGRPYTPAGLRSILRRVAPGITPYMLRHSFAQFHADSDISDAGLAGLLGHADTRTVSAYREVRSARLRRLAAGLNSPLQPPPGVASPEPGACPADTQEPNQQTPTTDRVRRA